MTEKAFGAYRRKLGLLALLLIGLHSTMALTLLIIPGSWRQYIPGHSIYNSLVLVGPFFQEARIRTSPHLYVSAQSLAKWSEPVDYAAQMFSSYRQRPWQLNSLRYGNYERYLMRHISSFQETGNGSRLHDMKAFKELNQMLMTRWIKDPVDSIRLVYCVSTYDPKTRISVRDTLITHTYNPADVALSKQP